MPKNNLPPSRAKFLSLLKQTSGIELEIVTADQPQPEGKPLRQSASGDSIYIKHPELSLIQRAARREHLVNSRQQNNLEQIFSLALEYVNQDAQFERLDLDWMMKFSDLASQSYSSTMHDLWAKILAVELSQPATFSYRSLKTLSEISTKEALLFYRSVRLLSRLGDEKGAKILTGIYKKPTLMSIFSTTNRWAINLSKFGLSYPQLVTLSDLGLIYSQEIESAPYQAGDCLNLVYQGQNVQMKIKQRDVIFTYYKFTQTGFELSKLVAAESDQQYLKTLVADFNNLVDTNIGKEQLA